MFKPSYAAFCGKDKTAALYLKGGFKLAVGSIEADTAEICNMSRFRELGGIYSYLITEIVTTNTNQDFCK